MSATGLMLSCVASVPVGALANADRPAGHCHINPGKRKLVNLIIDLL